MQNSIQIKLCLREQKVDKRCLYYPKKIGAQKFVQINGTVRTQTQVNLTPKIIWLTTVVDDFCSSKKESFAIKSFHLWIQCHTLHKYSDKFHLFTSIYQAVEETYKNIQPHLSNMICFS